MKLNVLKKKNIIYLILIYGLFTVLPSVVIGDTDPVNDYLLEELLVKIEEKHGKNGFKADFIQESTLKSIGETVTASGNVYLKKSGKMRWEYKTPETQLYISNGKELWAYNPEDMSVTIAEQSSNFDFLTDMQMLRKKYNISIVDKNKNHNIKVELIAKHEDADFRKIYLIIARETSIIKEIILYNVNDDETIIKLSNHQFDKILNESLFNFEIPEGTDII